MWIKYEHLSPLNSVFDKFSTSFFTSNSFSDPISKVLINDVWDTQEKHESIFIFLYQRY